MNYIITISISQKDVEFRKQSITLHSLQEVLLSVA